MAEKGNFQEVILMIVTTIKGQKTDLEKLWTRKKGGAGRGRKLNIPHSTSITLFCREPRPGSRHQEGVTKSQEKNLHMVCPSLEKFKSVTETQFALRHLHTSHTKGLN